MARMSEQQVADIKNPLIVHGKSDSKSIILSEKEDVYLELVAALTCAAARLVGLNSIYAAQRIQRSDFKHRNVV